VDVEITNLSLSIGALQADPLAPGWYKSVYTGQQYYYDGNQFWTVSAAGILVAMGYMNPAPKQVTVAPGDVLKITISFKYTGPKVTGVNTRYCIGVYGANGFDEKVYMTGTFDIEANNSTTPVTVTDYKQLTIPTGVQTNWDDIYVKMWGGSPDIGGSETLPAYIYGCENALVIVGVKVDISEFKIADFVKV
jgi:hypothetical protein